MITLREGNIEIRLSSGARGRKFDDAAHGLSHCMKAVDFVIELNDRILFVEIKDPEDRSVADVNRREFVRRFESGELDGDLVTKYRDSFLYEWAAKRLGKPVFFYVLIALSDIDHAQLLDRCDALERRLPVQGPPGEVWKRKIAQGVAVFNIDSWNKHLTEFPVRRT